MFLAFYFRYSEQPNCIELYWFILYIFCKNYPASPNWSRQIREPVCRHCPTYQKLGLYRHVHWTVKRLAATPLQFWKEFLPECQNTSNSNPVKENSCVELAGSCPAHIGSLRPHRAVHSLYPHRHLGGHQRSIGKPTLVKEFLSV